MILGFLLTMIGFVALAFGLLGYAIVQNPIKRMAAEQLANRQGSSIEQFEQIMFAASLLGVIILLGGLYILRGR
jgi:CHASE1-domain containing sensor protein